jgi:hypothetical protein
MPALGRLRQEPHRNLGAESSMGEQDPISKKTQLDKPDHHAQTKPPCFPWYHSCCHWALGIFSSKAESSNVRQCQSQVW